MQALNGRLHMAVPPVQPWSQAPALAASFHPTAAQMPQRPAQQFQRPAMGATVTNGHTSYNASVPQAAVNGWALNGHTAMPAGPGPGKGLLSVGTAMANGHVQDWGQNGTHPAMSMDPSGQAARDSR